MATDGRDVVESGKADCSIDCHLVTLDQRQVGHVHWNDRSLLDDYGLGAVVTTIDAVNGLNTLDNHQEAVKQIAVADLLLLTKTDLAAPSALSALRERIAAINFLMFSLVFTCFATVSIQGFRNPATEKIKAREF